MKNDLKAEKLATTGVSLIAAGMQELVKFGTMHNRVRLICASYLVKILILIEDERSIFL